MIEVSTRVIVIENIYILQLIASSLGGTNRAMRMNLGAKSDADRNTL